MRTLNDLPQRDRAITYAVPGSKYAQIERLKENIAANKKTTEDIYEKLLRRAGR